MRKEKDKGTQRKKKKGQRKGNRNRMREGRRAGGARQKKRTIGNVCVLLLRLATRGQVERYYLSLGCLSDGLVVCRSCIRDEKQDMEGKRKEVRWIF